MALVPAGGILGERLNRLMLARGFSPRSLSLAATLSADAARNILTGRSQKPTKDTLEKLAKALGVAVEQLVDPETPPATVARSPGVEVREVDLRPVSGSGGDLLRERPILALWQIPTDVLSVRGVALDKVAIVRTEGGLNGLVPGDRLLIDTSQQSLYPPGLAVVYLKEDDAYDLAQINASRGISARGGMTVHLEFKWGEGEWPKHDVDVVGRVVGRWLWM